MVPRARYQGTFVDTTLLVADKNNKQVKMTSTEGEVFLIIVDGPGKGPEIFHMSAWRRGIDGYFYRGNACFFYEPKLASDWYI